jgi:outer membrane putative beta-barrel porin/alpha-amylase
MRVLLAVLLSWPARPSRHTLATTRSSSHHTSLRYVTLLFVWLSFPGVARADDALVLPKGRARVAAENLFFFPADQRWGPHGNAEDLGGAFNNRRIDSSVLPLLSALNPFVAGGASIGDSSVRFKEKFDILDLTLAYGFTDRLTVGVDVPYYWVRNTVKASLNSALGSSANVGLTTGPGVGVPCGLPAAVLPLACPNTRRFTTEDVQQILGPGRPGISGFGFKRLQDFSAEGLGDVQLGAKYQYLRTRDSRLAATGGVRAPIGRQDDPDDLADVAWSTGAWALLARLHNDFILSNVWKETPTRANETPIAAPGDVIVDFTFRYDWMLPDSATVRVGDATSLTTNRERVDRDLGDRFEFEFAGQYQAWRDLSLGALYKYGFKTEDRISGHHGFPTRLLEKDTDSSEQIYIVKATYSTLALYRAGSFPLPLDIALSYRDRFAGSGPRNGGLPSQVLKTRYIGLRAQIIF